jgi:hypothetical protein
MEGAKDITGTPVFYKFLSGFCFAFFPPPSAAARFLAVSGDDGGASNRMDVWLPI